MGLRRFLQAEPFDSKFRGAPVVAHFSSVGSLSPYWLREFTDSLSAGWIAGSRGTGECILDVFRLTHSRSMCASSIGTLYRSARGCGWCCSQPAI